MRTFKNRIHADDYIYDSNQKLVALMKKHLLYERRFAVHENEKFVNQTLMADCLLNLLNSKHCRSLREHMMSLDKTAVSLVYKKFIDFSRMQAEMVPASSIKLIEKIVAEIIKEQGINRHIEIKETAELANSLLRQIAANATNTQFNEHVMMKFNMQKNRFIRKHFFDVVYSYMALTQHQDLLLSELVISKPRENFTVAVKESSTADETQMKYNQFKNYISFLPVDEYLELNFDQFFDENGRPYELQDIYVAK